MGGLFSSIVERLGGGKRDCRVVMVGLDGAGKTTLLYRLHIGEVVHTVPTIGFNVETVEYKRLRFNVWDIGGQDKLRRLWRHYYDGANAIIFVVDSNDSDRIDTAAAEIAKLCTEPALRDASLLVYANKQDLPRAVGAAALAEKLGLHALRDRKWYVQSCCATSGDGLCEGLDWLSKRAEEATA